MTRCGLGVLALLGAAVALQHLSLAVSAQQAATTGASPVHSVTITLAPGDTAKTCEIKALTPEVRAVYPGDTLTWHVENGCRDTLTVTVRDFTPLEGTSAEVMAFDGRRNLTKDVTVGTLQRGQISTKITGAPPDGTQWNFEYTVQTQMKESTGPPVKRTGKVMICTQPPCWPPTR